MIAAVTFLVIYLALINFLFILHFASFQIGRSKPTEFWLKLMQKRHGCLYGRFKDGFRPPNAAPEILNLHGILSGYFPEYRNTCMNHPCYSSLHSVLIKIKWLMACPCATYAMQGGVIL